MNPEPDATTFIRTTTIRDLASLITPITGPYLAERAANRILDALARVDYGLAVALITTAADLDHQPTFVSEKK